MPRICGLLVIYKSVIWVIFTGLTEKFLYKIRFLCFESPSPLVSGSALHALNFRKYD